MAIGHSWAFHEFGRVRSEMITRCIGVEVPGVTVFVQWGDFGIWIAYDTHTHSWITPPKTNMEPEKSPLEKEKHLLQITSFQVPCQFSGVYSIINQTLKAKF